MMAIKAYDLLLMPLFVVFYYRRSKGEDLACGTVVLLKFYLPYYIFGTVDCIGPFVTFYCNDNCLARIAGYVLYGLYRLDGSADRRVYRSGYEARSIGNQLSYLHFISDGNYRLCRSSEMLRHGDVCSLGNRKILYGRIAGYFIVGGMNTAHGKRFHILTLSF